AGRLVAESRREPEVDASPVEAGSDEPDARHVEHALLGGPAHAEAHDVVRPKRGGRDVPKRGRRLNADEVEAVVRLNAPVEAADGDRLSLALPGCSRRKEERGHRSSERDLHATSTPEGRPRFPARAGRS